MDFTSINEVKLTAQSIMRLRQCRAPRKGTKIAIVVVFGGGKAYDGTPNRRKQSASITLVEAESENYYSPDKVPRTFGIFCAANMVIFAPLTPLNYDFGWFL